MKRTIYISYADLTQTAKDNIIAGIKEQFVDECKAEGEKYLRESVFSPKALSWVEAYVRINAISYIMWTDYEQGKTSEVPDWQGYFDDQIEWHLNTQLGKIISSLPIEVEI